MTTYVLGMTGSTSFLFFIPLFSFFPSSSPPLCLFFYFCLGGGALSSPPLPTPLSVDHITPILDSNSKALIIIDHSWSISLKARQQKWDGAGGMCLLGLNIHRAPINHRISCEQGALDSSVPHFLKPPLPLTSNHYIPWIIKKCPLFGWVYSNW